MPHATNSSIFEFCHWLAGLRGDGECHVICLTSTVDGQRLVTALDASFCHDEYEKNEVNIAMIHLFLSFFCHFGMRNRLCTHMCIS